jgi:hypothetical protein
MIQLASELNQDALAKAVRYAESYYTLNRPDCVAGIIITYLQNLPPKPKKRKSASQRAQSSIKPLTAIQA